jgi:hypothetical protein
LRELPQGTVVLAFHISQAFELNGTGAAVFKSIVRPVPIQQVIKELAQEYELEIAEATLQILAFLEECARLGVVELVEPSEYP